MINTKYEQRANASDILSRSLDIIYKARMAHIQHTTIESSIIFSEYVDKILDVKAVLHKHTLASLRMEY